MKADLVLFLIASLMAATAAAAAVGQRFVGLGSGRGPPPSAAINIRGGKERSVIIGVRVLIYKTIWYVILTVHKTRELLYRKFYRYH